MRRRIVRSVAVLPTLLTLGNVFCGFLSMAYVADALGGMGREAELGEAGLLERAAWFLFLGMAFDALDGALARMTRHQSAFGAELDSLCDAVTFGAAPAFLVKVVAQVEAPTLFSHHPRVALWFSVLFTACAVLRLARYNVENYRGRAGPSQHFVGLPTPGAAGVLASLVLLHFKLRRDAGLDPWLGAGTSKVVATGLLHLFPFLMVGLGLLMISRVPFVHMLNRLTARRRPPTYVVLLLLGFVLFLFLPHYALATVFCGYVLASLGRYAWRHRRQTAPAPLREGGR